MMVSCSGISCILVGFSDVRNLDWKLQKIEWNGMEDTNRIRFYKENGKKSLNQNSLDEAVCELNDIWVSITKDNW